MLIDKDSLIVNNISLGKYILYATFGYHKYWSEDTGRNLAGTMSGTLIGIFPKITVQFGKLTREQLETLAPIFDSPTQTVTYYDANKKTNVTMTTYTGDYEVTNKGLIGNRKNESFSIAFISKKRRS